MHVYEKVRKYIDERGIKQISIAKSSNMSNSTLNAILNGKRTMYADDLKAICEALKVSASTFI